MQATNCVLWGYMGVNVALGRPQGLPSCNCWACCAGSLSLCLASRPGPSGSVPRLGWLAAVWGRVYAATRLGPPRYPSAYGPPDLVGAPQPTAIESAISAAFSSPKLLAHGAHRGGAAYNYNAADAGVRVTQRRLLAAPAGVRPSRSNPERQYSLPPAAGAGRFGKRQRSPDWREAGRGG